MPAKAVVTHLISKRIAVADLTAAAVTQSFNFGDTIPINAMVTGAWFDLVALFAGGGASSAVVDIGDGTDDDGYVDNEDVFTGADTGQRSTPTTPPALLDENGLDVANAAKVPTLEITSDVNVSALTTGSIIGYIRYDVIPGSSIA